MPAPFSSPYVLDATVRHALHACDVSTSKTCRRIAEFSHDPEKTSEVLHTLDAISKLRETIEGFRTDHPNLFK